MARKPVQPSANNDAERLQALLKKGSATIASVPCRVVIVSGVMRSDFTTVFPTLGSVYQELGDAPLLIIRDDVCE